MESRTVLALLSGATVLILVVVVLDRHEPAAPARSSPEVGTSARSASSELMTPASGVASSERVDEETPSPDEVAPATIREILLEIAAAEEAIVEAYRLRPGKPETDLVARLEDAVGQVLDERSHLDTILGLLAPDPEGQSQLGPRELYGAIRAVYWSMVISTGRGDGRSTVLAVLAALPTIHRDALEVLMANITQAAVDGELVLDASYLADVLALRSHFPADEELFSRLLAVIGESLTPAERDALFAVFEAETDDPVLAGLTIKNLLLGSDPDFGLLLAQLRFDSEESEPEVKKAIANAVVDNADVFSATAFLTERTDAFRNDLILWTKVGHREGGPEALEAEYTGLVENDAHARAREMLVAGMMFAPQDRLLAIAQTDPEPRVIGQALLSASARGTGTRESFAATLNLLEEHYPGGIGAAQAAGVAANTARAADRAGHQAVRDAAVSVLVQIASDREAHQASRRSAIDSLRPLLSKYEIEALEDDL